MAKSEEMQGLSLADLIEALKQLKGEDDDTLKRRAQYEAEAHQRLTDRENRNPPFISVYSYPEGDTFHPKPPLKCEMFWVGYPIDLEGITPEEVDLLNQATPGVYFFQRTDGTSEKLTVKGTTDVKGALSRLEFSFPCQGDNAKTLPSLVTQLRQAFGIKSPEQIELETLRALLHPAPAMAGEASR